MALKPAVSLIVAVLASTALAGCASTGEADTSEAEWTRLLAPGVYAFSATVEGQHVYADGRVQRYSEPVHGHVEISRPTVGRLAGSRPGSTTIVSSSHSNTRLSVNPRTMSGTVSVRLPETRREMGGEVCLYYNPDGSGECVSRTREYHEVTRMVRRSGRIFLTPISVASSELQGR